MDSDKIPSKRKRTFPTVNLNVLEYFSNRNLFMLCCIGACFSLASYLAAFSCEISWILEAHGDLPTISYLLCSGYFILFVASTILIHGLATGLAWGLFSWSVIIGSLAIPELCLVMTITTQFWGLQSTHGLTELIGYIIRLIINCLALLCVIPTALRWRREQSVLKQLQSLASRLQLATPPPSTPQENSESLTRQSSRSASKRRRRHSGVDNPAYIVHESQVPFPYSYGVYGSQNEFNASIFGLDPSQYIGSYPPANFNPNRTRSLLDLRQVMPTKLMYQQPPNINNNNEETDENDGPMNNKSVAKDPRNVEVSVPAPDPIYYTIADKGGKPSMMRNCVSMENLGVMTIQNDLSGTMAGTPMNANGMAAAHAAAAAAEMQRNFNNARMFHSGFGTMYQQYPPPAPTNMQYNDYWNWSRDSGYGGFTIPNPYVQSRSNTNSKQSLGSDDYRKYRDVAL